ncbi:hypothetical protein [Fulvimarina sp. MAC3]|uniref:hypothetical protein n=1 Tax=Fulvimarina sp. MAC3 TaxID=3148887 RepID=UPI0031FC763E
MHDAMRWHEHDSFKLAVAQTIGSTYASVYTRGLEKVSAASVKARLEPWQDELSERTNAPFVAKGDRNAFLRQQLDIDMTDETNWDTASDFIIEATDRLEMALSERLVLRT